MKMNPQRNLRRFRSPILFSGLGGCVLLVGSLLSAQHPDVEILPDVRPQSPELIRRAESLREEGLMMCMHTVEQQIQRPHTPLDLPPPRSKALSGRELWALGRSAHAIVTWHYLCLNCDHWHQQYAGGYPVFPVPPEGR